MKCVEVYKELYHQEPFDVAFCPYRISPLGAHIDHQYGKINGLAIDKGIHMAYHPKQNGVVELQSLNFPKRAQFFVSAVPEEKQGDWADHLRGAAKMLGEKYRLKVGLSGIIEGSLPIGGLSSSASVIICFLSALCKVNGIHLKPMEMILTAKAAENQYVGVSCGKLDQSCEVLSKKNHLLYLDTKDDSYELIPTSEKIGLHQAFWDKLKNVDKVVIIGWSAGNADLPYLRKIRESVSKNTKWYAYFYDDKAYKALNAAMIEGDIEGKFEVNYISTDEFWD